MWHNKYVGIPYQEKGRSLEGADCWGLSRLIYKNEFNIDLPSFSDNYAHEDTERIAELMIQYREGWEETSEPKSGDMILFRVLGHISHIGVMINDKQFIHSRQGQDAAIDNLNSSRWTHRVAGIYTYTENSKEVMQNQPIAFSAIHATFTPGMNLGEILKQIVEDNNIPISMESQVMIFIDGEPVTSITNKNLVPREDQVVEYRLIPGKDALKIVAIIAVVYFAPMLAAQLTGVTATAAAAAGGMIAATQFAATAVISLIGMSLVNAIFPVRPPDVNNIPDAGSSNPQLMFTGARNTSNQYQPIPVVLGQYRIVAPCAAVNYLHVNTDTAYLRMLLTWGYGPVDVTDMRVGATLLSDYKLAETSALPGLKTVGGLSTDTDADLATLYQVYGNDTYQVSPNLELINDGVNPATGVFSGVSTTTGIWQTYNIASLVNNLQVSLHFPEGLRGICREGENAGKPFGVSFLGEIQYIEISQTTLAEVGSWTSVSLEYGTPATYTSVPSTSTYYDYGQDQWMTSNTTVDVLSADAKPFYMRKDAFTVTVPLTISSTPKFYKVRIRRTNRQGPLFATELDSAGGKPIYYHKALVYLITGTNSLKKAAVSPANAKLALTALNIQATNQLNGSIDGINALVTSRCLDYDTASNTWIEKPTRNPASLFRYILQHPANAQRISTADAATKIDLDYLKLWWIRCNTNGYTYDAVVSSQKSVLDTLKDICAAGRASPLLLGGKWTVVEDIPRTNVVQHFTPHNSWGFEGSKKLSVIPHALRITFINSEKEYQSEERMVYNDGYNESNSSIFEAIQLPGVTTSNLIHKHGRFHLAQAKLRPEIYSLNTDMEFMVCNRGDLVRVSHDVPMWGTATGRIKTYINSSSIELDEPVSLAANTNYVIRIRGETVTGTGSSAVLNTVLANIVSSTSDRINVTTITLSTAISTTQGKAGNLYMIGQSTLESTELIVLSIEPSSNLTAKLTLTDYSPAVYTSDTQPIPAFSTNITLPSLFARDYITNVPIVNRESFRSDESVIELSGSSYIYKLSIPYKNPIGLNSNVTHVDARLCLTSDTSTSWRTIQTVPLSAGSFLFSDLVESEYYSVQLRYSSGLGFVGPWTTIIDSIPIQGRTNAPANVGTITVVPEGDKLRLTWNKNNEIDLAGYEVRELEAVWGTSPGAVFIGNSNTCLVSPGSLSTAKTWYVRAYDSAKIYSVASSAISYTVIGPGAPTNISASYTGTTALFKWTASIPGSFAIRNYKLTLTGIGLSTITATADTTEWEVPVTWVNAVTLTITPIDVSGNSYAGSGNTIVLAINIPSTPNIPVLTESGTNLVLDWSDNTISASQLTLLGYEIYASDATTLVSKGLVSKALISMIGLSGTVNYILKARDYKNQLSLARNISYTIPTPTDIQGGDSLTSTFGTSLTDSSLTIAWEPVTSTYGVAGYELSYDTTSVITNSNTITLSPLPLWGADVDKVFTIKTIDLLGNKSDGVSKTITKLKPNIVIGVTADVIDNNVMLYWTLPNRTSLPIDHVIVRKTKINGVAVTPINVGEKSGTFTTIFERQANTYTYEIAAVDTDKQEGPAFSLTVTVSQPPDFIFNGSSTSTFNGTASNAKVEVNLDTGINQVTMPIDLVSTVSQHFDTRGWTTPQNQINALYPIYSQPSLASGYYEEVIDFGTIIGSSQVTITTTGTVIAGTPIVISNVTYSADNITYSAPSTSTLLFISNFRYIRINVAVSQVNSDKAIYALNYINVRLDSKIKDDAGKVSCVNTHTAGTTVNFSREFIDVTSITVSPNSTVPLIPVYDFKDTVISATYSITSNVCTVTTSVAHGFSAATGAIGQKVRLEFTSGNGISGIYAIVSVPNTTQYTVALVTANTSGNVSTYSQGMRIYLYDTVGTRVSGTASWAIKGY